MARHNKDQVTTAVIEALKHQTGLKDIPLDFDVDDLDLDSLELIAATYQMEEALPGFDETMVFWDETTTVQKMIDDVYRQVGAP